MENEVGRGEKKAVHLVTGVVLVFVMQEANFNLGSDSVLFNFNPILSLAIFSFSRLRDKLCLLSKVQLISLTLDRKSAISFWHLSQRST